MKKTFALILIFALMLCGTAMAETLTMGSSMETNAEVEAPSRLMPYIIRK